MNRDIDSEFNNIVASMSVLDDEEKNDVRKLQESALMIFSFLSYTAARESGAKRYRLEQAAKVVGSVYKDAEKLLMED